MNVRLARILYDGWRHVISAPSEPARRASSARLSIPSPRKQFAFSVMGGVNPEEPIWQRPEWRFRPFGRIFHEKCGLSVSNRKVAAKICDQCRLLTFQQCKLKSCAAP